uniref:Ion channel n=1 Tax=Candidatus Kentrum sp. DK TaxID=2126562 RepID=A0A450S2G4_9GAMM|nr:MAG: Ion channel [Candidatus Kentron sp. DK]
MTQRENTGLSSRVTHWKQLILAVVFIGLISVLVHFYIYPLFVWPIFYLVLLPLAIFSPIVWIYYRTDKTIPIRHFLIPAIIFTVSGFLVYLIEDTIRISWGIGAFLSLIPFAIILIYLVLLTIIIGSPKEKYFIDRHFNTLISNQELGLWVLLFCFVTIANFSGLAIFFVDKHERENGGWGIYIDKTLYSKNKIDYNDGQNKDLEIHFCEGEYDFIYVNRKKNNTDACPILRKYSDYEEQPEIQKFREMCTKGEIVSSEESVCEENKNAITVADAYKNAEQMDGYLSWIKERVLKEKIVDFEIEAKGFATNRPIKGEMDNEKLAELRAKTIQEIFIYEARKHIKERGGEKDRMKLVPRFQRTLPFPQVEKVEEGENTIPFQSVKIRLTSLSSTNETESFEDKREEPKSRILDALYFAYYTITTTGYGDIAPGLDSIKFFTTVLNVIEFFFVVVVINILTITKPNLP